MDVVWRLDTGEWQQQVTIEASTILDLREVPQVPSAAPVVAPVTTQAETTIASAPPRAPGPVFSDPAILSLGRKPVVQKQPLAAQPQPTITQKREPHTVSVPHPLPQVPLRDVPPPVIIPEHTLSESLEGLNMQRHPPSAAVRSGNEEIALPEASGQALEEPTPRRRQRRRRAKNGAQDDIEGSPLPNSQGKGWRQTPMLENTHAFQPFTSLKRNGTKGRRMDKDGWASEDVTDVQEAGEFNFEDGLRKFDKRNLFEQMRKDDQIDDADRLVSHNRQQRPKPGTNGGKNLHASENVLEMPSPAGKSVMEKASKDESNDFWNSEADDGVIKGSERLSGRDQGSRQSSRRGESKMSTTRRSQSRKASGAAPGQGPARVNSGVSNQHLSAKISRPSSRLSIPVADKKKQPSGNASAATPGLYLLPSNRRVETVSALQMLNLENISHSELGFTEEMMTENAGRGIAEVTLAALADPAIKVRLAATVNPASGTSPPPTVVILAGNNKSSIRAVAAGRHLLNKGIDVLVCVMGIERNNERELLEDMRQQVQLFRNFGGRLFSKRDLFEYMRKASIPTLTIDTPRTALSSLAPPSPVTLIIDALLGLAMSFEELRTGDQTTCYELIEWANRNEAFVLAIDVPTGIDPSTGKVSVIDGNQLHVKPRYVVCMGAPKRGLLEAMIAGDQDDDTASGNPALTDDVATDWKLFVADIGLSQAVWKKAGTKMRRGIDFGQQWVVEMRYRGVAAEEDDMPV